MKKLLTLGILSLFFIFASFASAQLIPETSPCWVKGTITGDGITVDGLTVGAYLGNTLLKEGTIASGEYSLNTVGANDDDEIDLRVYGHTFATFTFVGFCKTGDDPWIVEDFTVSKQANGQVCNDNAICISGRCSSGVCAAQSSGGGGGGGGGAPVTTTTSTTTTTLSGSGSHQLIDIMDKIRNYYSGSGTEELTLLQLLDMIRAYYGGN